MQFIFQPERQPINLTFPIVEKDRPKAVDGYKEGTKYSERNAKEDALSAVKLVCVGCRGAMAARMTRFPTPFARFLDQARPARPPLIFHLVTPINLMARHRLSLMTMASSTSGFDTSPPLRPFHPHFRRDFWHCDGESAKYPRTYRLSVDVTRPRISRLRTPSHLSSFIVGRDSNVDYRPSSGRKIR